MESIINRVKFTKQMKKEYTILLPSMLPIHFRLIAGILRTLGYRVELLENAGKQVTQYGLRYVHNDTCYPAILVIGQLIDALKSGKYDPHKTALILMQTGGGCRASNYISLLRKALAKAGYGYMPVISFSVAGLESNPGFPITLRLLYRMLCAVFYGDLLMNLKNQCKPYEVKAGQTDALVDSWIERINVDMQRTFSYRQMKRNYRAIIQDFAAIPLRKERKIQVGIVGEIYVKYSPLGNNNLEDFLLSEGAEVVVPGLLDFCLYCVYNGILDRKLYGLKKMVAPFVKMLYRFIIKKQNDVIRLIQEHSNFRPPMSFEHTHCLAQGYIGLGTKMGEGWLLTAEMLELIEMGAKNIICTQPFGCLPNHIVGKGMMKLIKERHADANIVAIDYDAGATQINQENRIKLMLANAHMAQEALAESANF